MKNEFIFWVQVLLFALNIGVLVYLMEHIKAQWRVARIIFIVIMCVGFFINGGDTSWFAVLFCLTPFITLIKLNHADIDRTIKTGRHYLRGRSKHLSGVEGMEGQKRFDKA